MSKLFARIGAKHIKFTMKIVLKKLEIKLLSEDCKV